MNLQNDLREQYYSTLHMIRKGNLYFYVTAQYMLIKKISVHYAIPTNTEIKLKALFNKKFEDSVPYTIVSTTFNNVSFYLLYEDYIEFVIKLPIVDFNENHKHEHYLVRK